MKKLYLVLLFIPFLSAFADTTDPIDKISDLIMHSAVSELSKSFASTIELTINEEENIYSDTQAELILNKFFKDHQPRSVKILHRISSNPNYRFAVLILTTNSGIFRISLSLKNTTGNFILNELRIEAEKTK